VFASLADSPQSWWERWMWEGDTPCIITVDEIFFLFSFHSKIDSILKKRI
jgi:hypothetical protein